MPPRALTIFHTHMIVRDLDGHTVVSVAVGSILPRLMSGLADAKAKDGSHVAYHVVYIAGSCLRE